MAANGSPAGTAPSVRYVALGDSFTEGVGDPYPDGVMRGWADLVADGLASAHREPIGYANLAVRGNLLAPIVDHQLPTALRLDPAPTVLTINGGGNDMLRPDWDPGRLRGLTVDALRTCLAAEVRPVLISGPDPSQRLPFGKVIHARGSELTAAPADLAAEHGVTLIDLFHDNALRQPQYWSADRLHLNSLGHRRAADLVLAGLGVAPAEPDVSAQGPAPTSAWEHLAFATGHLLPWLTRRALGRSSGDGREPKHRDWAVIEPVPSQTGSP